MANPMYGQNRADNLVDKVKSLNQTAVSGSIHLAVTHTTNYDIAITQPARTYLKDLILVNGGDIVTNGSSGNDLDMSMGAATSYTDLMAATALLDDGGSAVTAWTMYMSAGGHLLPGNAATGIYLGVNSATAANLLDDYEEGEMDDGLDINGTTQTGYSLSLIHI